MINYDKIRYLQGFQGHSEHSGRIIAEINYACNLNAAKDGEFEDVIEKAVEFLANKIAEDGVITKSSADTCENMLLPLKDTAKSYTIHCIAHAHIDMNWMWGYNETVSVTVDTFRTMLDLMNEYPEFTFAQSQASTYEIIEKFAPSMLGEIKQRIHEGRWEISASTWVETDKNMPNGESLARHILYTKQYLSNLFDIPSDSLTLDFEPDTFGHNASVPEICSAGGVKYYYHCRGSSHEHDAYIWKGLNGGELIVYRDPHWYSEGIGFNSFRETPMICKKDGIASLLCVYGVGDHGGGPTRKDIERIIKMSGWPIMPTIKFSSYKAFFKELEAIKENLPTLTGERNFIFDGCYTSQARIKMANRLAEDRAFESESIAAMSQLVTGADFVSSFRQAWKNILFNQFHDILPGSGTVETREHALGRFQDTMAALSTNANIAMHDIAKAIDTREIVLEAEDNSVSEGGGTGYGSSYGENYRMPSTERGRGKKRLFHLYNPTEYAFDGICEITVFDWRYDVGRAIFTYENGEKIDYQILEGGSHYWGHDFKKFALKVKIPAFGYTSCILDLVAAKGDGKPGLPYMRNDGYTGDDIVLENSLVKAVFNHMTMELKSFTDKKTGRALISSPSCIFNLITENTIHGMTSWRVGDYIKKVNLNLGGNVVVHSVDLGGLRKRINYDLSFGKRSDLDVNVTLDENSTMLKFDVRVDFHEVGNGEDGIPQLSFSMPFSYSSETCRFDIPFGTVDRKIFDFDVPANSFAIPLPTDSEDKTALMLVTDSKYGFRYTENNLSLALIRGSFDPDPYPEYGVHKIHFGVGVCTAEDDNRDVYEKASRFVHPISYCTANLQKRDGELGLSHAFIKTEGNIKISSVKSAENGKGIIIRFFTPGKTQTEYKIALAKNITEAYYTDINERPVKKLEINDNSISGPCAPGEIITVLLKV